MLMEEDIERQLLALAKTLSYLHSNPVGFQIRLREITDFTQQAAAEHERRMEAARSRIQANLKL